MDKFLHPIIVAFAWVWVKIHELVSALGLNFGGGAGWAISIVVLTLVVRILILPLYIKQIKSQRGMQAIQPELQKLQAKYKGKKDQVSRQRQSEEMMELYKKNGTSPYASCLPLIVQMPVLFALYRVIFAVQALADGTYRGGTVDRLGPLTQEVAQHMSSSTVFGVGLFDRLNTTEGLLNKAVFVLLIIVMVGFQFFSMYMGMKKNMPPSPDPNNPMVRSQKTMLYMMPAMFAFTGFIFQMALLIYMVTTAVFSWAQQLWVLKVMPTPGAPAYEALLTKRQTRYQDWAKPYFADYATQKLALDGDEEAIESLYAKVLSDASSHVRRAKIFSKFPPEWNNADKVAYYHDLARDEWESLPDQNWFKGLLRARRPQDDKQNRVALQPKKLSREQRLRRAELERDEADLDSKAAERAARKAAEKGRPGSELTPEEIERRRQERRAAQRAQNRANKKKKK